MSSNLSKSECIEILDPFGSRSDWLNRKTHKELLVIYEKALNTLYSFYPDDYDPKKILPKIGCKISEINTKDKSLRKREENILNVENDLGINNNSSRKKDFRQYSKQKRGNSDIRSPDPVRRQRLFDPDPSIETDAEIKKAIELSKESFLRETDIRSAIESSFQDEDDIVLKSYENQMKREKKEMELEKINEEESKQIYENEQKEYENMFSNSNEDENETIEHDSSEIIIDENKYKDRPSDISIEFLTDVCKLLKEKNFSEVTNKLSEISTQSSRWFTRLRCGNSTLRSKLINKDSEAYKCILCRK